MSVTFLKSKYIHGTPILISSRVQFAIVLAPDETLYNSWKNKNCKLINGPRSNITVGTMLCHLIQEVVVTGLKHC